MLFASTIPFVGRQAELHRIADFCRFAIDSDGLSALWIAGEAGIGKSRLIEQALAAIDRLDAIILRVRFYPEATTSILHLLHTAISLQPQAALISRLSGLPESGNVVTAIRRLARLRRTIIICEDVHTLPETEEGTFTRFLYGLVHEPIGLICTARPGDFSAYRATMPYIIQSLTLQPLLPIDLDELLNHYGMAGNGEKNGPLLHQITKGVPLVVRSVLPELIEIDRKTSDSWNKSSEVAQLLRDRAAMSISSIVREVIGKLSPQEQQAAAALAGLGEVFAEHAATLLLGEDSRRLLSSLRHKGIISSPTEVPKRLIGEPNGGLTWEFTHSLLYEELSHEVLLTPQQVVRLLQENVVLYSSHPILHLTRTGITIPDQGERIEALYLLVRKLEPHVSETGWETIKAIEANVCTWFTAESPNLPESVRTNLELALTFIRTRIAMFQPRSVEVNDLLQKMLIASEHPKTFDDAIQRIIVLTNAPPTNHRDLPSQIESMLAEVDVMTQQFPSLILDSALTELIISITGKIRVRPYHRHINQVRRYLDLVEEAWMQDQSNPSLTIEFHALAGHVLPLFSTAEELADRDLLVRKMEKYFGENAIFHPITLGWGHYLIGKGCLHEARQMLQDGIIRNFQGRPVGALLLRYHIVYIEALMGAPLDYVETRLKQILSLCYDYLGESAQASYAVVGLAVRTMTIGKLCGEHEWGIRVATEIAGENDPHLIDLVELYRLVDDEEMIPLITATITPESLLPIFHYTIGQTNDKSTTEENVRRLLLDPIVNIERTFEIRAIISLMKRSARKGRPLLESDACQTIREGLRNALQWCFSHHALGIIPVLLRDAQEYLPQTELAELAKRTDILRSRFADEFDWPGEAPELPMLKMLGSIVVVGADNATQRVQGARGRRILGLMIANDLMDSPQSPEEFRTAAADGEGDSANTVRVAIARLRALLGKNAIISDGQAAPRLNYHLLRVDMIDVMEMLARCDEGIQTQKPRLAKTAAIKALDMVQGEPAYPTLYGDFFDAARQDFELRLRQTILSVARFLCREEDYEEAVDLLRNAFAQMPQDEIIAEELISVLQLTGRNAEAVSVRQKMNLQETI